MCSRRSDGLSQPISDCTYLEGIERATINTHVFISDAEHEVTTLEVDLGEARPVEQRNVSKWASAAAGPWWLATNPTQNSILDKNGFDMHVS